MQELSHIELNNMEDNPKVEDVPILIEQVRQHRIELINTGHHDGPEFGLFHSAPYCEGGDLKE